MFSCCVKSKVEKKTVEKSEHDIIQRQYSSSTNDPIRILLLGTGESGKSTLIKQMKLSYIRLYTSEEKKSFIPDIRHTLHESIYGIAIYIQDNNLWSKFDEKTCESIEYILKWDELGPSEYIEEYFKNIYHLWRNISSEMTLNSCVIDCAKYFLDRLPEISNANYIPNEQDILTCRKRTIETQKTTFRMKLPRAYGRLNQEFWLYDVGGQRNERRKWIQTFAGVHAVLFLVATSEFNQTLREDNTVNRLQESLNLFQEVWTSRFLLYSGFLLFLNKQDILKKKIESGIRLEDHFPKFKEWKRHKNFSNDYECAKYFIQEEFMNITKTSRDINIAGTLNQRLSQRRIVQKCFSHFTIVTETNHIRKIFEDVHKTIMLHMLNGHRLS